MTPRGTVSTASADRDLTGPPGLRVVFGHDFAEVYGGAERIIAEAAAMFPDAPFWAVLGRGSVARRIGVEDRFHTLLAGRPVLLRHYRLLAPILPAIVGSARLPEADVLVSSSYAYAHGFRTGNDAPHVCYCYSPLRFAWSMEEAYGQQVASSRLGARAFVPFAAAMRSADRRLSRRPTTYLTESEFTQEQILRFYDRPAAIVPPPVDCELFRPSESGGHDDFWLFCGRLVEAYKRPSLVVEAFAHMLDRRLVIAGDGPALEDLRRRATPNVEFVGHLEDEDLVSLMQRCTATIFPSRDDFGLLPVEVAACGRPVLAFAGGGALRTVVAEVTGAFFERQDVESIVQAVENFDPDAYDVGAIRGHALQWDRGVFRRGMLEAILDAAGRAG